MTAPSTNVPQALADDIASIASPSQAERNLEGALAEQRHQLIDLDLDSAYTVPGSCICACPPKAETA